ncbi:MAG: ostA-like family protein [Micavibrio aeruginosavorus]|uniref:OstA-like family protein n=1 Tax=Micavibrio aeruginosavorus TaxID=349221 RepID=A0A7T5R4I6_9BACT|nr:MAG: ostA-like family protein [Micavibrio aeruginosavorus]
MALMALSLPAMAQQAVNSEKDKPLEITAEQTLEWHRNDKKYIARGSAEAVQGAVRIHADTLSADYREGKTSNYDIYRMTAEGQVVITSQGNQAYGDKAVYEIDSGMAVMTGQALKMTAPNQILTARDKFEYGVTEGRLSAYGDVVVTRPNDKMQADKASAFFSQDAQGADRRKLERLEAEGNVIITTATETLRGDRGIYNAGTNIAEVTGNVKIIRGPNVLEGNRAEINLTTNVSRMFGNQTGSGNSGRVKGVFYPDSASKPTAPAPAPAATPAMPSAVTVIPDESPDALPPPLKQPRTPASGRLTAP